MKHTIREYVFWAFDFLKGSGIRKNYKDIVSKSDKEYNSKNDLNNILEYAIKNVPFYSDIKEVKLEKFPVMNKVTLKEQGENCISIEYKDKMNKLYKASTSGSTGTPLVVYQDMNKKNRCRADLIRAHEVINWKWGDKYIFIRNWSPNYKQSIIRKFAQNVIPVGIASFNDEKKEWLCKYLLKHKNCVIFGYSSSICDFMNYIKRKGVDANKFEIKLIVCDSDELSKNNKKLLKDLFKCNIINRYDNEENGLIAISKPESDILYVNNQSLIVELLEPSCDKRVKVGELGRVVITDLYNKAMPLIRYDTGDYAISNDTSNNIKTIKYFAGRKADALKSTKGVLISSVAISGIIEVFYGINKYQMIQNSEKSYELCYTGMLLEKEKRDIDDRLRACLGENAVIKYSCKKELLPSKNGKFKTIINKCEK